MEWAHFNKNLFQCTKAFAFLEKVQQNANIDLAFNFFFLKVILR